MSHCGKFQVAAVPQVQYPVHHYQQQQQVSNYPMVTYSSDPTLSPVKQMVDMQRHEVVREKTIPVGRCATSRTA